MNNIIEDAINKIEKEAKTSLEYLDSFGLDRDVYDTQLALLIELIMGKIIAIKDQTQSERIGWNELEHPTLSFLTEKRQELISRLEKDEECTDYIKILANSFGISPDDMPLHPEISSNQAGLMDENTPMDELTSGKPSTISRDAVGFLFRELRNKGIVKPITDTELAEYIEGLTGYSKEKIRQNNPMTVTAKCNLRFLLLSIADKLN